MRILLVKDLVESKENTRFTICADHHPPIQLDGWNACVCELHIRPRESAVPIGKLEKPRRWRRTLDRALSLPSTRRFSPLFLPRYFLPRNRKEGARVCVEKARQKATFLTFNSALYKCLPSRTLPVYGDNRALTKVTVYGTPLPSFVRAYVRECAVSLPLSFSLPRISGPVFYSSLFFSLPRFCPLSFACSREAIHLDARLQPWRTNERTDGRMTVFGIVTSVKS